MFICASPLRTEAGIECGMQIVNMAASLFTAVDLSYGLLECVIPPACMCHLGLLLP